MRRAWFTLAALLFAAVLLSACHELPVTGPVQQTNLTITIGPTPSPTPTPAPPDCGITSISIVARAGSTFPPQFTTTLDATPRGGLSGGTLPNSCVAPPIAWTLARDSASCAFLGAVTTYNPDLRCETSGEVTVNATISGVVGTATFTVTK